jgi:hypothetical protein
MDVCALRASQQRSNSRRQRSRASRSSSTWPFTTTPGTRFVTNGARFFDAMDAHRDSRILVHCAANYRVTAFLGLYRTLRLGIPRDLAFAPMRTVWEPNEVWARFIEDMLDKSGA